MAGLIERAARALGEQYDGYADPIETPDNWARAMAGAKAVLTAMREPTTQMLAAVDDEATDKFVARGRAYSAWVSMIDAALAEE